MHRRQDGIRDFISPVFNIKPKLPLLYSWRSQSETVQDPGVRKTGVDAYPNICYNKE